MRRYLIVDDNLEFAENLAEILRDRGDEVVVAESGPEAIDAARRERFDALLTDMRMPAMGGTEVVHEIRRLDPGAAAMVITAHVSDETLETARREGVLAVMPKPVPVPRLVELLEVARRDGVVLLVEDDHQLADNLAEALRSRGFAPVTAASIPDTEKVSAVQPLCALVDLRVPGGPDGEALRRLAERYPGMPLIVVTALDGPPPLPHDGLFTKPFDTGELLGAVERLHASKKPRGS
jgi:CheY-like chemotaxis protein